MRILNYGILATAAGTLLLLAACGENSPQQNAESTAPQTETVTTVTTAAETTAETTTTVPYLEQCRAMLAECPNGSPRHVRRGLEPLNGWNCGRSPRFRVIRLAGRRSFQRSAALESDRSSQPNENSMKLELSGLNGAGKYGSICDRRLLYWHKVFAIGSGRVGWPGNSVLRSGNYCAEGTIKELSWQ